MASVKPLSATASPSKPHPSLFFSTPKNSSLKLPAFAKQPTRIRLTYSRSTLGFAYATETSEWPLQAQEEEEFDSVNGGIFVEREEEEEPYIEPSIPEETKIFVGNLPFDVDSEKLALLFEKSGPVELAEVIYNRENDRSRGFGFVTMNSIEEAERAVEMFNQYDLEGRTLTVAKASPNKTGAERIARVFDPVPKIYVGNLPWGVDSARLEQVFSAHGKVVSARVVSDRDTGRSRGFGFVMMASKDEVNSAIAALDGQGLDGRSIRVNVAEERPRRSFS